MAKSIEGGDAIAGRWNSTEGLTALFFVFSPFQILGVELARYPITPSSILLVLLAIRFATGDDGHARGNAAVVRAFVVFVAYAICITVLRQAYASFLFLVTFVALYAPTCYEFSGRRLGQTAVRSVTKGGILSLAFVLYDVGRSVLGLPMLNDWLPVFMPQNSYRIGFFWRVSGSASEPAHYAIFMAFAIMFLDLLEDSHVWGVAKEFVRAVFIVALVSTFSLSGIVLVVAYFATRVLSLTVKDAQGAAGRTTAPGRTMGVVVGLGVVGLAAYFLVEEVREYFQDRILQTILGFQEGELVAAERANYFLVGLEYLDQPGIRPWLGEATVNVKVWLEQNYYHLGESSMAQGAVANIYLVVLIGLGLIGLLLYAGYQVALLRRIVNRDTQGWRGKLPAIFMVWVLAHFATGHMVYYTMPGIVLLLLMVADEPSLEA